MNLGISVKVCFVPRLLCGLYHFLVFQGSEAPHFGSVYVVPLIGIEIEV